MPYAKRFFLLGLLLAAQIPMIAPCSSAACDLAVTVDGIKNTKGTIRLELDSSESEWDNKSPARAMGEIPAAVGSVTYVFKDVSSGVYGIGVYQDENNTGTFETNFFGIPKEGFGFSNNPHLMRKPTFQEVGFTVPATCSIVVHLIHM